MAQQLVLKFSVDAPDHVAEFIRTSLQRNGMRDEVTTALIDELWTWLANDAYGEDHEALLEWDHVASIAFVGVE